MKAMALALLITFYVSPVVPQQQRCPLSGADEKFLIQRRLQGLRATLLAQLGLENTNITVTNTTVSKEQMDTFIALSEASKSLQEEDQRSCQAEEIYAQPITTFVGTVENNNANSRHFRTRKSAYYERNILSTIEIDFDFNLKESLTSITRGDILLYQLASPNQDSVVDLSQYVEIKAVFKSLGLKTVIAAKSMNFGDEGFQAFDITPAMKLWIQRQINGTVQLEITVTCLSSKRCAEIDQYGNIPAGIKFDFQTPTRKPRLVVVSQNPLEVSNRNRVRRQSRNSGVSYCNANQSTCCLKNLTVNFAKDLDMGFILFPESFQANYCEGICPLSPGGDLMTPQIYSFISELSNSAATSIEPCCAGNKFKPLTVVIADPKNRGGTIVEEIPQIIVDSCRCA